MESIVTLLGIFSVWLIGIGAFFILVDLRTRFDPIFRYFGISLILIASMAAIDLYTGGSDVPLYRKLDGQRILHLLACVFFPFSGIYLMLIAGLRIPWARNLLIGLGLAFAPLVPFPIMLRIQEGNVIGGPIYLPLFFPFAVFYICFSYYVLARNLLRAAPGRRRLASIHLAAFIILTLSGLLDMIGIVDPSWKLFVSYKIFGILIFGAMSAYVFTERFFSLIKERDETYARLDSLRAELDAADPFRKIGESTARISHEIKNHLATMKSTSRLILLKNPASGFREEADRIERSAERLEGFTKSILNYASCSGGIGGAEFPIRSVFVDAIRECFPDKADRIALGDGFGDASMKGDKSKLEQVTVNLLKNAFEAGASRVEIGFARVDGRYRIRIEDDGLGCAPGDSAQIGKPFFTTKKGQGGTGLGIAISSSIVQSFGGELRMLPRHSKAGHCDGMRVEILFPDPQKTNPLPKDSNSAGVIRDQDG